MEVCTLWWNVEAEFLSFKKEDFVFLWIVGVFREKLVLTTQESEETEFHEKRLTGMLNMYIYSISSYISICYYFIFLYLNTYLVP